MRGMTKPFCLAILLSLLPAPAFAADPRDNALATGIAAHAFDHLGDLGDQADAAAASGCNIIYATGVGSLGYTGLPPHAQIARSQNDFAAYVRDARSKGIRLVIGYVCATSIVKLDTFAANWPPELREKCKSPPAQWLQQDKAGKPLASWYGGDYRPACMNNPDWRNYEAQIVRLQLESGCDGIFFDNPTVHPQGCFCPHCMEKFGIFLKLEGAATDAMRKIALDRPEDFWRFRCTIAADFLRDMQARARQINPNALITCNNSLNSPEVLYSQCRTYGYNIDQLGRVEDLVVVEDMATQPRVLADGSVREYGYVYDILHAISHDKPIVACVLADGDYHTPPNLMRLAMAEAAAHDASYMSWPTWPEKERPKMIAAVRPQAEFLRANAQWIHDTSPIADVALVFDPDGYVISNQCPMLILAQQLAAANIPFRFVDRLDVHRLLSRTSWKAVITDIPGDVLVPRGSAKIPASNPDWLTEVKALDVMPVSLIDGPSTIRTIVRQKGDTTIVHVLNLNVERLSSFEDKVTPATNLHLRIRYRAKASTTIKALTADADATHDVVPFTKGVKDDTEVIELTLPRVDISTLLIIQ